MKLSLKAIVGKLRPAGLAATLLGVLLLAASAVAQTEKQSENKPATVQETIFLHHVVSQSALNDVLTALRSQLPHVKNCGVADQNAITITATAEDLAVARKIVADLDKPLKSYRLTYTLAVLEGSKRTAERQYTLIVTGTRHSALKQGARVPIVTGAASDKDAKDAASNAQIQYVDVGLHIDADVNGTQGETNIEETSVSEERSGIGPQAPILRQTTLNERFNFTPGKPVVLGLLAIPGATQRELVEVTVEPID
jgi:hypothetical protein